MRHSTKKQDDTQLNEPQKLERVKDKMITAFRNACCNVKDDPVEAAYYYSRFIKYAGLYGGHINKIFKEAGKPTIDEKTQCQMACKAVGKDVDDVNRLASVIEHKLSRTAPSANAA